MDRLYGVLEGAALAGLLCGIYWAIGFFCKSTFGFEIRRDAGYYVCIAGGFVGRHLAIKFLSGGF